MARTKNLRAHKDSITNLYNKVLTNGFYSHEVKDIFNPQRIHMLTCSGLLESTGNVTTVTSNKTNRKCKQWKFSLKGVRFVKSFEE